MPATAEKEILKPSVALKRVGEAGGFTQGDKGDAGVEGASPTLKVRFVKNFGVADVLRFKDGTKFTFRLIQRNDGGGYAPNSFVDTNDEKLIGNLRQTAKNKTSGVVEIRK